MFSLKDYAGNGRSIAVIARNLSCSLSASHKKSLATLSHLGSLGGAPWRRQARQTSLCENAFKD
jgi:hypothetical protein